MSNTRVEIRASDELPHRETFFVAHANHGSDAAVPNEDRYNHGIFIELGTRYVRNARGETVYDSFSVDAARKLAVRLLVLADEVEKEARA